MKFNQTATLIGVVGKKGSGQLDNGQTWSTDRVELHIVTPFPDSDLMAHGSTVTTYNVENYLENYEKAKAMIGQEVSLSMDMIPSKKLGSAPRLVCIGFSLAHSSIKRASLSPTA
jgi:hypothetical protein